MDVKKLGRIPDVVAGAPLGGRSPLTRPASTRRRLATTRSTR
jgi:hypothetical protein